MFINPRVLANGPLHFTLVTIAAMTLLVSACGGGGGRSRALTGQFVDSPVAGLSYKTPTRSGVTDADGRFEYRAGENVEFSLGNTVLGEADGKARITPFDLVSLDTAPVGMREIGRPCGGTRTEL